MAVVCGFFNTFARNNQCPSSERAPPRRAASGFLCGGGGTAVVKISASSHLETSRREATAAELRFGTLHVGNDEDAENGDGTGHIKKRDRLKGGP